MNKALEYQGFWATVVDGAFCVGDPFKLFLENRRLQVPVIIGHTSSEFFARPDVSTKEEFKALAVEMFADRAEEFLDLCQFDRGDIEEVIERASVNSIEYAIRIMAKANEDTGANTPCIITTLMQKFRVGTIPGPFIL